jgi:hypothetical protein
VIREWLGLAALNVLFLGVGTALLFGLGIVRAGRDAIRFAGLALLTGWAGVGIAASYALMLGAGLSLWEIGGLAIVLAAGGLAAGRRVPRVEWRSRGWGERGLERVVAGVGAFTLAAFLEVLFLRARLAEPSRWDTWAFWMPKAETIVYFDGIDTSPGGFTSFANPDYPPLKPAVDAVGLRFLGDIDPGALAVQNWVLVVAFFGALAVLLSVRVRPVILWPSLALVVLLPDFSGLVGSLLADEWIALLFPLAGVCGALWLLEPDLRRLALASLFLATAALVKNEGLMLTIALFIVLAVATRARRWRQLLPAAAFPFLAIVPWRLWMNANDVPETSAFRLGDVARPAYMLDRIDRLGTALRELPPFFLAFDRWLLTVPVVVLAAAALVRVRPALSLYALGTIVLGVLGFATVYWASTYDLDWYIDTTAERVLPSLAVLAGALFPLLVSEALEPGYPERRARSSAVRAADS